eukprot:2206951-Rhodomonas_salina.2
MLVPLPVDWRFDTVHQKVSDLAIVCHIARGLDPRIKSLACSVAKTSPPDSSFAELSLGSPPPEKF